MKVRKLVSPQRHGGHGEQNFFPFAGDTANGKVARPPSAEIDLSHRTVDVRKIPACPDLWSETFTI
jgi:hypothetical protein